MRSAFRRRILKSRCPRATALLYLHKITSGSWPAAFSLLLLQNVNKDAVVTVSVWGKGDPAKWSAACSLLTSAISGRHLFWHSRVRKSVPSTGHAMSLHHQFPALKRPHVNSKKKYSERLHCEYYGCVDGAGYKTFHTVDGYPDPQ